MRVLGAAALCAASVLLGGGLAARDRLAALPGSGRAGQPPVPAPRGAPMPWPVVLDLLAAVVSAGAPAGGALRAVGRCLDAAGDPRGPLLQEAAGVLDLGRARGAGTPSPHGGSREPGPPDLGLPDLLDTLSLSARTGLAPVPLLRAAAAEQRRRRREGQAVAAARLGVLVVLPTSLCLLPAFVLLSVVPLVLDLLT